MVIPSKKVPRQTLFALASAIVW